MFQESNGASTSAIVLMFSTLSQVIPSGREISAGRNARTCPALSVLSCRPSPKLLFILSIIPAGLICRSTTRRKLEMSVGSALFRPGCAQNLRSLGRVLIFHSNSRFDCGKRKFYFSSSPSPEDWAFARTAPVPRPAPAKPPPGDFDRRARLARFQLGSSYEQARRKGSQRRCGGHGTNLSAPIVAHKSFLLSSTK